MNHPENPECSVTLRAIVSCVARARGIPERHLYGRRGDRQASDARLVVYWLARELPGMSSQTIGNLLGDRDHSTILSGARRVDALRATTPALAVELDGLKAMLLGDARASVAKGLIEPDALAAADRIAHALDPVREGLRASALEIAGMALRLVDLEEVAGGTTRLIASIRRAGHVTSDPVQSAERRVASLALMETIESALVALGYVAEEEESESNGQKDEDRGTEPARAAE
jgi:hypothetical protein